MTSIQKELPVGPSEREGPREEAMEPDVQGTISAGGRRYREVCRRMEGSDDGRK